MLDYKSESVSHDNATRRHMHAYIYACWYVTRRTLLRVCAYEADPTLSITATQATMKGVTARQVEDVGITLILNNTYHLGLRPGTEILDLIGGKSLSRMPQRARRSHCRQVLMSFKDGTAIF